MMICDRPHSPPVTDRRPERNPEERAERLKERVYVTFSALAVVITLNSHQVEESANSAASTLFVTVLGSLLAVFLADLISHISVHQLMPTRRELRQMLAASLGSLVAVVVPLLLVGAAGLGLISVSLALGLSAVTLLGSLLVVSFLAVRRVHLTVWQRIIVLFSEAALGAAVVAIQIFAHS